MKLEGERNIKRKEKEIRKIYSGLKIEEIGKIKTISIIN